MKYLLELGLAITLVSCAALGSKTIYRSNQSFWFKNIGLTQLHDASRMNSVYPKTDSILYKTLQAEFEQNRKEAIHCLDDEINFLLPNKPDIIRICSGYKLHGLIIPSIRFLHPENLDMPNGWCDSEVQLKLFDYRGELIMHTSHRTSIGNTYGLEPGTSRTIKDATEGALRKMLREYQQQN